MQERVYQVRYVEPCISELFEALVTTERVWVVEAEGLNLEKYIANYSSTSSLSGVRSSDVILLLILVGSDLNSEQWKSLIDSESLCNVCVNDAYREA